MATIAYLLQSDRNPSNIYLRFSVESGKVFKRKSGYVIDPKKWSPDNKEQTKGKNFQ